MKQLRATCCVLLALMLALSCTAVAAQAVYYDNYDYLLGSMEVVNVRSYTWLRESPNAFSSKLIKVPVGAVVTNCYYYDGKFTYCEYGGMAGYIASGNLSFISGPVGYEYPEEYYLGNFQIVNCASYASLRAYPDTSSTRLMQIPLGAIVTNVYYQDDRFSYCVYGDMDGYILNSNLAWVSGGNQAASAGASGYTQIGTAVIVNCLAYASLRAYPDTGSTRIAKVPVGSVVTNVYIVDDRFAYCEYAGMAGYILLDNLGW